MKIDGNSRYEDFLTIEPLLSEGSRVALKARAVEIYGDPWGLTLADFIAITGNDLSRLGDMSDPTILQMYWLQCFHEFVEQFQHILESLKMPMDATEEAAAASMKKVSMAEGMLVYARGYFGLHSFSDAEQITITEYVMARRDDYNKAIYNRRLAHLRAAKLKKK